MFICLLCPISFDDVQHEVLGVMGETKSNNEAANLRRYWRFFLPLTLILVLMVRFPLRIDLRESFYDTLFYGTISLICIVTAIRVYRRSSTHGLRLIVVILLCSVLSGWQIFDLVILRYEGSPAHVFASTSDAFEPLHHGWAWYNLRFPNHPCQSLFESYFGNHLIAITLEIKRDATWFSCGG
jgi:hypothetical protein